MKLYRITNFVIVALVMTALYQTSELWLRGTSSHNFFSLLQENAKEETLIEELQFSATSYAISEGGGFFEMHFPQDLKDEYLSLTSMVISEMLAGKNVKIEQEIADWKTLLNERCIVLQYEFEVAASEFFDYFGMQKTADGIEVYDYIVLVPGARIGNEGKIYLVNSRNNTSLKITSNASQTAPELYKNLITDEIQTPYISTAQRTGTSIISRNIFLPQWATLPYEYKSVKQVRAFEEKGEVDLVVLENAVTGFFRNFSLDWSTRDDNGNYVFSDSATVVKYYIGKQVLEYYNYEAYGNNTETASFFEGYQICEMFLKNDSSLENQVYLADVQKKNNEVIYYFDYLIDDLPIVLSEEVQDKIESEHAIEITLKGHMVKRYQRYAMVYELNESQNLSLDIQFIDALDNANKEYRATVEERVSNVGDILLAYYANEGKDLDLKWFITLNETQIVAETLQEKVQEIATAEEET